MTNPYATLPAEGPYEVAIGRALITMIEPKPGCDREYNRWYEDDHFYSGAMAMPWMFAGRRWVAPRDLQELRHPEDSTLARPLSSGKYISVYWITAGREQDHSHWSRATHIRAMPDGRVFLGWKSVFTSFHDYAGAVYRDERGPRDIHALDYPYEGMVLEVVEPTGERDALEQWLRDEYLPQRLSGSPVAMTLLFEPDPVRPVRDMETGYPFDLEVVPGQDRLVTMVSFAEVRPSACWEPGFAASGDEIGASGLGHVVLGAPFVPTIPGTDVYVDGLG